MKPKIDDRESTKLEMEKIGKTQHGLRKVKSVESGLGSFDSCGFVSSGRSSNDSFIAVKDEVNGGIRISNISEELENEFNELRIIPDSNLQADCEVNKDEIFVEETADEDDLYDADEDIAVFDGSGNGATRRPTPYPFNDELHIAKRRSNTASFDSMRTLSSQTLSDACSLLDEIIAVNNII